MDKADCKRSCRCYKTGTATRKLILNIGSLLHGPISRTYCQLFVEVPDCMEIMQECMAFQLIWISFERTADCEICCKQEQLNWPKHLMARAYDEG